MHKEVFIEGIHPRTCMRTIVDWIARPIKSDHCVLPYGHQDACMTNAELAFKLHPSNKR